MAPYSARDIDRGPDGPRHRHLCYGGRPGPTACFGSKCAHKRLHTIVVQNFDGRLFQLSGRPTSNPFVDRFEVGDHSIQFVGDIATMEEVIAGGQNANPNVRNFLRKWAHRTCDVAVAAQRSATSCSLRYMSMQPTTWSQAGPLVRLDPRSPRPSRFRAIELTKDVASLRGNKKPTLIFFVAVHAGDPVANDHA